MSAAGISIREATGRDAGAISRLIVPVAESQIAHEFDREGRDSLLGGMTREAIRSSMLSGYRYFVGFDRDRLVGAIGMRGYSHIYHLFVARDAQRRGVASRLWEKASAASLGEVSLAEFTVFSSVIAEGFYRRMGFRRSGEAMTRRGVTGLPMRLKIES